MATSISGILDIANSAYQNGELRLNEQLPDGERGDGLADFIRMELIEVTGGEEGEAVMESAISAMESAKRQLEDLIAAFQNAQ